MTTAMDKKWRVAACGCCNGLEWGGDSPRECTSCGGTGSVWIRPSGHVFLYPGGPALGRWSTQDYAKATMA